MIRDTVVTLTAIVAVIAPVCGHAADANVNVQIVDALNQRYGVHPGYRANHAKGIVVEGNFTRRRKLRR